MTKEQLIDEITEARRMFVLHWNMVPHYVSVNSDTRFKLGQLDGLSLEVLIDDKLADDEFRLLRK